MNRQLTKNFRIFKMKKNSKIKFFVQTIFQIKNKTINKIYMVLESMSKKIKFPDCSYFQKGSNIYIPYKNFFVNRVFREQFRNLSTRFLWSVVK